MRNNEGINEDYKSRNLVKPENEAATTGTDMSVYRGIWKPVEMRKSGAQKALQQKSRLGWTRSRQQSSRRFKEPAFSHLLGENKPTMPKQRKS